MCSLNQVADWKIVNLKTFLWLQPPSLSIGKYIEQLYQQTEYSVKVHVLRFNCGLFSHFSIVLDQNTITYLFIVNPKMCKAAFISQSIKVTSREENFDVPIAFNEKKLPNFNSGVETRNILFGNKEQVKH